MPLTPVERAIVRHEVALKQGDATPTKEWVEVIGIGERTYYEAKKKPAIIKAVADLTKKVDTSKDYAALMSRTRAIEKLDRIIHDKDTKTREVVAAIGKQLDLTEFADENIYEIEYDQWSDEDLEDELLQRRQRLGLTEDEFVRLRTENLKRGKK